jgi:hypothetical protein
MFHPRHPVPHEGRFAIVTDVGTGCGGRGSVGRDDIAGRVNSVSDHRARKTTALMRLC